MSSSSGAVAASASSDREMRTIYTFLIRQPQMVLSSLYEHSLSCLAVFRTLSPVGRHYVMRLLYTKDPIELSDIEVWCTDRTLHREAIKALEDLKVLSITQGRDGRPVAVMDESFCASLKVALTGSGIPKPISDEQANGIDLTKKGITIEKLNKYATERWEAHLAFLVGSTSGGVCVNAKKVLLRSGLMAGRDESAIITSKGFQFLLQPTTNQVWLFMLQFFDLVKDMNMDLVEVLKFQFQLSFSKLGQAYLVSSLTPVQQKMLQILRGFGLAYRKSKSDPKFYPTRLSIAMSHGMDALGDSQKEGFLIVETNMRVFAYTSSTLEIALLGQFVDLRYRFPGFVVGVITRESCRQALVNGIAGNQIVGYIQTHAHPQMRTLTPVIPVNVTDQIMMWEKERDRLVFNEGYLYQDFPNEEDAKFVHKAAIDFDVLIWANTANNQFFVTEAGHERIRRAYKKRKEGMR